jgi:hypothetical protein
VDEQQVRARLLEVAEELTGWWQAALRLRVDRAVWEQLGPTLQGHHGKTGAVVAGWYRDALLIRCRRLLVEGDRREESPRRTLNRLAQIADRITEPLLVDAWIEQGTTLSAELVREQVRSALTRTHQGMDLLSPTNIASDAKRLADDHETISRFVSRAVAHQDRRRHGTEAPTVADVDALLDDVLEVVQRYAIVVAGVHLDTDGPQVSIRPTVRALELFDWAAFVEAVGDEAVRRFEGQAWPPDAREHVDRLAKVRFVWPDAD